MANPKPDQNDMNLRTLQALEISVLQEATSAADTTVSNAIQNHHVILDRNITTKCLDLSPDGSTEKNRNMNNYRIVGLKDADPETESEAVNLRTLNRKIQSEIEINNQLVAQKYLRLDGENQIVSDLQIYNYKPVGLADATAPTDGVNKKVLDDAVNSLARLKVKDTLII